MISAVFRRGGDVAFVVEELKAVFDPRGGQWMNGRYVPSLLAAIGGIIEQHMIATGFLEAAASLGPRGAVAEAELHEPSWPSLASGAALRPSNSAGLSTPGGRLCPNCQQPAFIAQEGCWVCQACGFSKCT